MVKLVTTLPVTQMPGVRFPVAEDLIIIFKTDKSITRITYTRYSSVGRAGDCNLICL